MTGVGAVAAWSGPVLVIALVARVTAGGVEAPLFVLAVLAAPLLALLAAPGSRGTPSGFTATAGLVTIVCVLGAGFRAIADLGHVLGLETGAVLGAAVALVLITTIWWDHRVAASAFVLGAVALLSAVVMLGVAAAVPPWTAWSRVASRGAFELGPRSEWTREGAQFPQPTTLTFTEPHRITAATEALVRVTERDRVPVIRERKLAAGESLALRPGDTLAVSAGARLRFEAGRRVPGAPPSGVTWADAVDATRPRLLAWWAGLTLTLAGGALMIVRPLGPITRASALFPPALVLTVVLAATCWGVYAVDAAPELSIGAPAAAAVVRLVPVLADEPWRSRILTAVAMALLALFLGSAAALRRCLVDLTSAGSGGLAPSARRRAFEAATWIVMVVIAVAVGMVSADGFTLLVQGLGLGAAVLLGPRLTRGQGIAVERARAKGALAGGLIFVVVAALAHWPTVIGAFDAVTRYPALVAVPGAWLVTTIARGGGSARR
ncbi:MAG TPA: hypothetical protein VK548_24325 [Candidatus Acidoferrum sp.]|nr:hypothetical protein [Candidatus Acidoferrum sp.]